MTAASVIGPGTVVRGNVRGDGNLEIHGRVEGDVTVTGDVLLAESAAVRGSVTGTQLSIAGAVQGDLRGTEAVLLERGARVVGDLTAPRIGVAPGALVRGTVRTDGEAPLAQPARRPAGLAQPLRSPASTSFASKPPAPAVRAEVRHEPPAAAKAPVAVVERAVVAPAPSIEPDDAEPAAAAKRDRQEPPPPVVPALGKHAKAKKKRREA